MEEESGEGGYLIQEGRRSWYEARHGARPHTAVTPRLWPRGQKVHRSPPQNGLL